MTSIAEREAPVRDVPGGHPRGLYVLFGAEMWERFSYYGMRALLVLYLTNHLDVARANALDIYATYTGLVYLTPLLGGYLADRYLGQRKAILIGGILMALGHFAMAFEPLLNLALGLLILGNGFFKPNISTMVGQLYPQGDSRRDSAYTIFYMGINLGAFFSPLVCGTLGENVGWHYGFGAAGVGMVLGLLNFTLFQRTLGSKGFAPGLEGKGEPRLRPVDWVDVVLLAATGVGLVMVGLAPRAAVLEAVPGFAKLVLLGYWILLALALVLITRVVTRATGGYSVGAASPGEEIAGDAAAGSDRGPSVSSGSRGPWESEAAHESDRAVGAAEKEEDPNAPFTSVQWQRIAVILIVAVFSIVFWMGFEQAGGTLTLFADKKTDRVLAGNSFPASWYQSVNPLLIIALAPLFSMLWSTLDRTRFKINSAAKMGLGLIFLGLGTGVMYIADHGATEANKAGPHWLVMVYALFTVGELCLSPIGLSVVNKLAPARIASLMMALWFTCTAIANYLAGKMESIVGEENLWGFLIATSIVPGVLLLLLNPLLKKMGHGRI
jgi:proton-dependent oligopeptide transporter, POT family